MRTGRSIIVVCFILLCCNATWSQNGKSIFEDSTFNESDFSPIEIAEIYYQKAIDILKKNVHNALSDSLANQARKYINYSISIDPTSSEYLRVKGSTFIYTNDFDAALINYNYSITLDSTNLHAWMGKGIALENTYLFEMAEQCYFRAIGEVDLDKSVYLNLGILYRKWGKDSLSIDAYNKSIELNSKSRSAYLNRGIVKLNRKNFSEAIEDFNMAIHIDSTDKLAYNSRGFAKHYLLQYQDAIVDFKRALTIDLGASFDEKFESDSYTYNNLANSYLSIGDIENACIYWRKALENGYVYKIEWKEKYKIADPKELIKQYCIK